MSDDRFEIVRRSYAAFDRLDAGGVVACFHPECVWTMGEMSAVLPRPEWRGHDGLRAFVEFLESDFDGVRTHVVEMRALGQAVLVRGINTLGMKTMGRALELHHGQVIEFRDGLIERVTQTADPPPGWEEGKPAQL